MLVLSRGEDESICIGEEIRIHVVHVSRTKVRLAVQAPKGVSVVRSELLPSLEGPIERDNSAGGRVRR